VFKEIDIIKNALSEHFMWVLDFDRCQDMSMDINEVHYAFHAFWWSEQLCLVPEETRRYGRLSETSVQRLARIHESLAQGSMGSRGLSWPIRSLIWWKRKGTSARASPVEGGRRSLGPKCDAC
jgi:hypothetical protein